MNLLSFGSSSRSWPGLAYVHIQQGKNDELLAEIRKLWPNTLR